MRGLDAWLSFEPPKNPYQSMEGQDEEEEVPDDESPEVCTVQCNAIQFNFAQYTVKIELNHLHKEIHSKKFNSFP